MALIDTVAPENATGTVAEVYADVQSLFGFLPNAVRLDSLNPEFMARHWGAIKQILHHPSLSQELFTSIRLMASEIEHCEYCIGLNAGMLMQMHGRTPEDIAALKRDPASAPLPEKERALLVFVVNTLKDSNGTDAAQVQALRDAGATDREIFDAVSHGAQQVAGDIVLNAFKVDADLH